MLHLPVRGNGDGGIYSTAADLSAFWDSLFAGRIVSPEQVAQMVRPRSDWPEESRRYGLGFHLDATGDGVWLEGHDAGVSFSSVHQPTPRSPTPSSRTGRKAPGRSSGSSATGSAPERLHQRLR